MALKLSAIGTTEATTNTGTITGSIAVPTGGNSILIAGIACEDVTAGDRDINTVVFNTSESLTKIGEKVDGDREVQFWYILNPTATTAAVLATFNGTVTEAHMWRVVLIGAEQSTAVIEATASAGGTTATPTLDITTVGVDAWVIDVLACDNSDDASAGDDQLDQGRLDGATLDSNMSIRGPIKVPAATTMKWTKATAGSWAQFAISILPFNYVELTASPTDTRLTTTKRDS